jgi:UTP--glucose-1-phosphate uridylyltransferase
MDISKAIIPTAGLGTRLLPITKSIPKEMLPLLTKPALQYIIEEGLQSGIKDYALITSSSKQAIQDYFDYDPALEHYLKERDKLTLIADLDRIIRSANFIFFRQPEPLGVGDAIWRARHIIGKEYFGVCFPDDIITGKDPGLAQLIRIARQEKGSVIAVQEVPTEYVSSYGIIEIKKNLTQNLFQVNNLVEKPSAKDAPSNLAIVGRYILSHKIFPAFEEISAHSSEDEIGLTQAIAHMIRNGEKVFAYKLQGRRYDIGTPLGWLKGVIGTALDDPIYGPHIQKIIQEINTSDSFLYNKAKALEHTI